MYENFITLKKYLSIAHHIKGRIRLKIDLSITEDPLFEAIKNFQDKEDELFTLFPGITDKRINLKARSIVVVYDPTTIAPNELEDFIKSNDQETVKSIIAKYRN